MADSWFSAYKDREFSQISLADNEKISFSEAIARDGKEFVLICAMVTACGNLKQNSNNKEQSGKELKLPCLATFKIIKTEHETEYQGKKTKKSPNPAGLYFISQISDFGFDRPFSGSFDFSIPEMMIIALSQGSLDGKPVDPAAIAPMKKAYCDLTPLEALTAFTLESAPKNDGVSSGGYAGKGGGMQKELSKLEDRLMFIDNALKPDSQFRKVLTALCESELTELEVKQQLSTYLVNILN